MAWKTVGLTSINLMLSNVSTQGLQWFIMFSLAHREGPRMLGIYAIGQAIALPLQFLSLLAIRQRHLTLENQTTDNFLAMRVVVPAVLYTLALLGIFIAYRFEPIFKMSECIFLLKYIEGFFDLAYSKIQKDGHSKKLARLSVARSLTAALLFQTLYWLTGSLYVSMIGIALQQVATIGYIKNDLEAFLPSERFSLRFSIPSAVALVPFALSSVLSVLSSSFPRFILDRILGAQELGYYIAVITFVSIGQIAVGALGQSLLAPISHAIRSNNKNALWSSILVPAIATQIVCYIAAAISLYCGKTIVVLVYGSDFSPAIPLLIIGSITSGPFLAASFFTVALFAAGKKYALIVNQTLILIVILVLSLLLVPFYRAEGAFFALGISGIIQMIICSIMLYIHTIDMGGTLRVTQEHKLQQSRLPVVYGLERLDRVVQRGVRKLLSAQRRLPEIEAPATD